MPELTVDIAVANRFISSLSKSLQALCHGCMEFDTGIEIIGYININIDSGSKVDYVLNEKVLKSTNNSMTFVSNSFLAKKEQQRHTRDGACSPIPAPSFPHHSTPIYQARQRGSNFGAAFQRSSQFSPHSQVLHGGQKRQWSSDWRNSKKHRPSSTASELPPLSSLNSSHTFTNPNYTAATSGADSNNEGESEVVNIKKEALDADSDLQDQNTEQDQSNEDQPSNTSVKVKIKCDPDAVSADETNKELATTKESTDFKGTFLDPSQVATDEQNDFADAEKLSETGAKPSHSVNEHNVAGPSSKDDEESDEIANRGENFAADMPVDYDEGNEDYPQSVQSDAGEASSDAGQFEVIEIDDEDENVQAMFGNSRFTLTHRRRISESHLQISRRVLSHSAGNSSKSNSSVNLSVLTKQYCPICQETLPDSLALRTHLSAIHHEVKLFVCRYCDKIYHSARGLHYHIQRHNGKNYICAICNKAFTRDLNLKQHLNKIHQAGKCPTCKNIFRNGQEYNQHVVRCTQFQRRP